MRTVIVAAAVLVENRAVLLSRRKVGTHLAGMWEFPGGKVEAGEDPKDALVRELREELGIEAEVKDIVCVTFHRYEDADKAVLLLFYEVARTPSSPAPRALDVAEVDWVRAPDLDARSSRSPSTSPSAWSPSDSLRCWGARSRASVGTRAERSTTR